MFHDDLAEEAALKNASASFADVEANGQPAGPLPFPPATIGLAERVDAPVFNPFNDEIVEISDIIYERHADLKPPDRAYWVGNKLANKLAKCIFGEVKSCTILKYRNNPEAPWEVTEEKAVVKIVSKKKIRDLRHVADPRQDVAAMQYLSQDGAHPHVMSLLDVLEDDDYLLLFMPLCSSGDLFTFVEEAKRFEEPMARYWFKQILEGLAHLQKTGICHRDVSLENILVNDDKTCVLNDFSMCLRVTYAADDGGVTDVSEGTLRLLTHPLIPCGKPNYISPEILKSEEAFDGFAVDLWASAVILFIMLVGVPPWEFANAEDPRYRIVTSGGLVRMLESWKRPISASAADLLQKMLKEDPRQRLSLTEVQNHPWVLADEPPRAADCT